MISSKGRSLPSAVLLVALAACGQDVSRTPNAARQARAGLESTTFTGPYDLAYDEAGRLVQVTTSGGETVQYVYDPAGNLLEIRRIAAGTLSITGFDPARGARSGRR